MNKQKLILLLLNLIGGVAVIGSYILGLRGVRARKSSGAESRKASDPSTRSQWSFRPSGTSPSSTCSSYAWTLTGDRGRPLRVQYFYPIFCLILIPSAFWMPLTNLYADAPAAGTWTGIRVVLFVVGLASIALAWALFTLRPRNRGKAYWAAVVGSCYLAFHTFVLDAILWAALFRG